MILRKPYAFLIKNFKKIHLLLLILIIYLTFYCNNILNFFKEYIATGTYFYNGIGDLASKYVNVYMYITSLVITIVAVVIFILMRQKHKPKLAYSILIVFHLLLLIFFGQVAKYINVLEITNLSPQLLRVLRDITLIVTLIQYGLIAIVLIRAVGFDIRKFNFGEDLQQLQIEASDNEEFELTVGVDTQKIKRKIRRQGRELKYFFIENLFVISLISGITIIILGVGLFLNFQVYNKMYEEKQSVSMSGLTAMINDSFYTTKNYKGIKVAPENKGYIIVKMSLANPLTMGMTLKLNNFNLIAGGKVYPSVDDKYNSFFDLGIGYSNQTITAQKTGSYILVFEINKEAISKKMTLRYTETAYYTTKELKAKYRKIKLQPESLELKDEIATIKMGDKMWLGQSLLQDSSLTINNIILEDKFYYNANICYQGICNSYSKVIIASNYNNESNTLLKMESMYQLDPKVDYMGLSGIQGVISKFGKLKYTIDNKEYTIAITNYTPSDYKGSDIILQVPSIIKQATKIDLILTVRNKEYTYVLK